MHGLFGGADNLSMIRRNLQPHFNVLSVDLPDHGKSAHSETFSFADVSQKVIETLACLHIEKAHFVGHSLGGKVVMHIALTHSYLIDKLVVLDIAPVAYKARHTAVIDALNAIDLNDIHSRKDAQDVLTQHAIEPSTQAFLLKSLVANDNTWAWRFNLALITRDYDKLSDWPLNSQLTFNGETLFIIGANSDYVTTHHQADIKRLFPNAGAKIVQAGHWLHAEKTQTTNTLISRFLAP